MEKIKDKYLGYILSVLKVTGISIAISLVCIFVYLNLLGFY